MIVRTSSYASLISSFRKKQILKVTSEDTHPLIWYNFTAQINPTENVQQKYIPTLGAYPKQQFPPGLRNIYFRAKRLTSHCKQSPSHTGTLNIVMFLTFKIFTFLILEYLHMTCSQNPNTLSEGKQRKSNSPTRQSITFSSVITNALP